jgi:predicted SnoaL-like aldol condensation-catalyzing enzyme
MGPARMSRVETAIRVVIDFNEAFNKHDINAMMKLMSDDCLFENTNPAPDGTIIKGKDEVTQFWEEFFRESPYAHIEIEEIFSLSFRCVMRWKYTWKDASGISGYVRGVDLFKVTNGLINEKLSYVKG